MSIYSEVREAVRQAVNKALPAYPSLQVIHSHGDGDEIQDTYAVVYIDTTEKNTQSSTSALTNEAFELTLQANFLARTQVSFIGSKSGEISQEFLLNITGNPVVREELQRLSLNVSTVSSIRRAPQKREGQWVEYHNLYVNYTYSVTSQQLIDVVESVDLLQTVVVENESTDTSFSVPES